MRRNVVEWTVLALSIGAIVLLVGVLLIETFTATNPADPRVLLRPGEARQREAGWIVPAAVSNAGDEAAEGVVLEASATVAGEPETSEIEVAFLPAGSTVEIAFSFSSEPDGEVSVRLVSYRLP
jgi:uncharacterized protein (TIGR02588 family)